jgi:hypothetical protein
VLEQIYTSTKTATISYSWSYVAMVYLKTWDALVFFTWPNPSACYKLFRDGSQAKMLEGMPSVALMARVDGRHAWMNTYFTNYGEIYSADEITGNYHPDGLLNPNCISPIGLQHPYIDDNARLLLTAYTNGRVHRYDLDTGNEILPYLTLATGDLYDQIAWAGTGRVFMGCKSSGRVALVDYLSWQILWQSKVRPCAAMAYDCLHDLVITLESDGLVRLYLTDPVPAQLSAPVFVPDSLTQYRLKGSKVKTRLTGDVGEAIPKRVVTWSLLNSKGYLGKDKTLTDADGWAENYYFGPDVTGILGAEAIKVETGV